MVNGPVHVECKMTDIGPSEWTFPDTDSNFKLATHESEGRYQRGSEDLFAQPSRAIRSGVVGARGEPVWGSTLSRRAAVALAANASTGGIFCALAVETSHESSSFGSL